MGGPDAVAVSAPGKVLLAGGYLVLDRAHSGLVFALDARIHVVVQGIATTSGVVLSEITVHSPQFHGAVWEYGYRLVDADGGINVTQLRVDADLNLNRNVFIETALSYALSYISSVSSPRITPALVAILADNDYYSTSAAQDHGSSDLASGFHNFGVPLSQAHKTGLGSSAALVTSFVAALLSYYLSKETWDIATEEGKRRLHNLAQAAHCAAQGKVGSGFDVASAVYGSCVYRRFSPSILVDHGEPGQPHFATRLRDLVEESGSNGKWDTEIHKDQVNVPKGLRLVLCDVSCGSQTPGMVRKVSQWRRDHPEKAGKIWADLQAANSSLAAELQKLADDARSGEYGALKAAFARIRELIRLLSEQSDVPIEPPAQTRLLDACENVDGVIGGVVPGAGGYDAIALLIQDKEAVSKQLKHLFAGWEFDGEVATGGKVSMLGVREELHGVRLEQPTTYKRWLR